MINIVISDRLLRLLHTIFYPEQISMEPYEMRWNGLYIIVTRGQV